MNALFSVFVLDSLVCESYWQSACWSADNLFVFKWHKLLCKIAHPHFIYQFHHCAQFITAVK